MFWRIQGSSTGNKNRWTLRSKSPTWEANGHSASQAVPRHLWNLNDQYRVHKSLPLVPILNQAKPDMKSNYEYTK